MVKTNTDKIERIKEQIRQLENQQKQLIQKQKEQERKERTHRLIECGAIAEKLIDGAENLTNEQFKELLTAALNSDPAIETLLNMQEQAANAAAKNPATAPAHNGEAPTAKPEAAREKVS